MPGTCKTNQLYPLMTHWIDYLIKLSIMKLEKENRTVIE